MPLNIKILIDRAGMAHDIEMLRLGYEAAAHGEKRSWCAEYGDYCVTGWDAYWDEFGP